jgi:broad specificity phosphatase PhoE
VSEAVLLLVRHAESSWNASGRWQGHGDPVLTELGRAQALALARDLAGESIDAIVSSDLRRAVETAVILGEGRGLAPVLNPRLRELDLGDWEGLTRTEIENCAGEVLQRFDAGDREVRPGGGENLRELEARARSALREIIESHPGERLAVVTHLGVIRSLLGGLREIAREGRSDSTAPKASPDLQNAGCLRIASAQILESGVDVGAAPDRARPVNL